MTALTSADSRPLAIDLCCGLGGWTEGLLAEGWTVIGVDVEQHVYGEDRYPGLLMIRDVLTLHGSRFKGADLIVASPPCQEYSYMAMPWKLAKAKAAAIRADETGAALERLNRIFNACFRIQREACEAAGRHIPMVVENVRGAQPWVGRAAWNFGSYYLWGDVPALMPQARAVKNPGHNWSKFAETGEKSKQWNEGSGRKVPGFRFDGSGRSFQTASVAEGRKGAGAGAAWFDQNLCQLTSRSLARKAASAKIAKIPFVLSSHIARVYLPQKVAV